MKDYMQLAVRYLQINKKRSALTILGVAFSTVVLFVCLNGLLSLWATQRNQCREEVKYEAVLWCESREVAQQIAGERYIKEYEIEVIENPKSLIVYENAMCVNFEHPYQMNVFLERITQDYGVTYDYTMLADFYFVTGDENFLLISALFGLLVAYIFAILGVAVVRNSIQLISLEQIKDYGVLRCIGCTKKQLKRMVYRMGFLLEMSGMILGIGLGFVVYLVIAYKMNLEISFHVISVIFILLAFLGDLYFVMQENCRFVNKLTPMAAVQGVFKINQIKLKARGKGIAGRVFGIEGEYAAKNLKRNPSRLWKCVGAMSMGISMVVVTISVCGTITNYLTEDTKQYGRYQLVNSVSLKPGTSEPEKEGRLLGPEQLELLEESEQVACSKAVYEALIYTKSPLFMPDHEMEAWRSETYCGEFREKELKLYREGALNEQVQRMYELNFAASLLKGYDEEDYKRLGQCLVEGTLDLSDEGIVLVNGVYTMVSDSEIETLDREVWRDYTVTDLSVGDRVEFIDMQAFDALAKEKMVGIDLKNGGTDYDYFLIRDIQHECYRELIEKGATKTYVIEGIVRKDVNRFSWDDGASFVLPVERYLEETGYSREKISGTMYHIKGHGLDEKLKSLRDIEGGKYVDLSFLTVLEDMGTIWSFVVGGMWAVLFVVLINLLNISNTTASDLYLRRKEFAQLRVLGISQKRLTYMVMLEGVFTAILADVIGVLLGYGIVWLVVNFINLGYNVPFSFSWGACVLLLIGNTMILCLTVYVPIRGMVFDMAQELQGAGE